MVTFVNVTIIIRIGIDGDTRTNLLGNDPDADEGVRGIVHFQDVERFMGVFVADGDPQPVNTSDLMRVSVTYIFGQRFCGKSGGEERHVA